MKAVVFNHPDAPCEIKEVEIPRIGPHQVLISLRAASLNRRDYWIKKGIYQNSQFPCIVGSDGAGVVEQLGRNVDKYWLKKEVIINPGYKWGDNPDYHQPEFRILGLPDQGTLAEYIVTDVENLAEKPDSWSFEKASALPLAGLTAYRALFTRGKLKSGEKVLITGAGGGVSTFLIKFAKAAGANVYVTSGSEKKIKKAINIGAIGGVNYKSRDWDQQLLDLAGSGFELIVDSAAGEGFGLLPGVLKLGGRIVIFGGTAGKIPEITAAKLFWKQASILGTTMGSPQDFKKMLELVISKNIHPEIDKIFPLVDTELAFKHMEKQEQFGKIVIKIQ